MQQSRSTAAKLIVHFTARSAFTALEANLQAPDVRANELDQFLQPAMQQGQKAGLLLIISRSPARAKAKTKTPSKTAARAPLQSGWICLHRLHIVHNKL
jgi:hypothetical protein